MLHSRKQVGKSSLERVMDLAEIILLTSDVCEEGVMASDPGVPHKEPVSTL